MLDIEKYLNGEGIQYDVVKCKTNKKNKFEKEIELTVYDVGENRYMDMRNSLWYDPKVKRKIIIHNYNYSVCSLVFVISQTPH